MKVGLIGLGNSGKTTVFNLLTGLDYPMENYYSPPGEIHLSTAKVLDERLRHIYKLNPRENIKYVELEFVDLPGLTVDESAADKHSHAELLGHVRDVDALIYVVRAFDDPAVIQPYEGIDPKRDIEAVELELFVADLEVCEKRLQKLDKEFQARKDKTSIEHYALERCKEALESEKPIREIEFNRDEEKELRGFRFLSQKPVLVLLNIGEKKIGKPVDGELESYCRERNLGFMRLAAEVEEEIFELEESERAEFMSAMGIDKEALPRFVEASFKLLNLISFFTIGDKEVKAWTVPKGTTAAEAAGKIHSDMERGFIRAEVVSYADFAEASGLKEAAEAGHSRLEGKEHVIHDGDIIHFRFSV